MISGQDFYAILCAVTPLYVAMMAGYGSVRWWKILTKEQAGGIQQFVSFFAVPLLSFYFISQINPYKMNFRFIAADAVSKVGILTLLGLWAKFTRRGSLDWMITIFTLATLPNTLVMGIPLLAAMYGEEASTLMVQVVVLQCVIWYTLLLFLYEYRAAKLLIMERFPHTGAAIASVKVDTDVMSLNDRDSVQADAVVGDDGRLHVQVRKSVSSTQGLGLDVFQNSSRGSRVHTPRPSNFTEAEIYSLHSSVNATPRESTSTRVSVSGRGGSPGRLSNFNGAELYSLHSSRGPTPRPSNFSEQHSKDLHVYPRGLSPHTRFPIVPVYGRSHAGMGVVSRGVPYPGQYSQYPVSNLGMYSPTPHSSHINKNGVHPTASPKLVQDAAVSSPEMCLFSPGDSLAEAGLTRDMSAVEESRTWTPPRPDQKEARLQVGSGTPPRPDQKETRLQVGSAQTESNEHGVKQVETDVGQQNHGEHGNELDRDEFPDKDGPGHSREDSNAELTPQLVELQNDAGMPPASVVMRLILVMAFRKLARNPNTYSSALGIIWSLVACRWDFKMPVIIYDSYTILSNAGLGMAMFSLGLFMAMQGRLIVCGPSVAILSMAIRFITGPGAMAAASLAVGLRGTILRAAIVQAALPQGIVPFVFAKDYNLHADILSTSVIFGMVIAFPITLLYYVVLGL